MRYYFLFVLLLSLIIVYLLVNFNQLNFNDGENENANIKFYGSEFQDHKSDCSIETIYSMSDDQCDRLCIDKETYISRNGICMSSVILDNAGVVNKCSPIEGLYAYIVGNEVLGNTSLKCLSIDPGIRSDNIDEKNKICGEYGTYRHGIDYIKSFPQISNCECANDDIQVLINATNSIRGHSECVNNDLLNIFQFNDLLYIKNDAI